MKRLKRLFLIPLFLATAAVGPCDSKSLGGLTPDENSSSPSTRSADAGTRCSPTACDGQGVPAIACATGQTVHTCTENKEGLCRWQISCPDSRPTGDGQMIPPTGPACAPDDCAGQPVPAIGCAEGDTKQTCVPSTDGQCRWQTSCPGAPGGNSGSPSAGGGQSVPPSLPACAPDACAGQGVPGVACASGPTNHVCVPDASGQCRWQLSCSR